MTGPKGEACPLYKCRKCRRLAVAASHVGVIGVWSTCGCGNTLPGHIILIFTALDHSTDALRLEVTGVQKCGGAGCEITTLHSLHVLIYTWPLLTGYG